jgi:hypothetical protein
MTASCLGKGLGSVVFARTCAVNRVLGVKRRVKSVSNIIRAKQENQGCVEFPVCFSPV